MKILLMSLLLSVLAAPARSEDCAKNADACTESQKKASPFLEAAAAEPEVPARPADIKRTLKPAPAGLPVPAVPAAVSSGPVPAAAGAAVPSSPLWLLFIAGSVSALYFYLRDGAGKGKRK